jgi:uncharacterized repeat protein (TIGR02543 family)
MKIFNLIKRLWTDSHEKQSPQRFGRYAAMLIMLLTLGVGQMWGAGQYNMNWKGKVYFRAPNDWDISTYSTIQVALSRTTNASSSNYICYLGTMTRISNTRLFYLSINADHSSWGQNEYIFFTANNSTYGSGTFTINTNHYYTTPCDYGCNNASNYYLFNPSSEGQGASVSGSWNSTRNTLMKLSNTIAVKVKKAGSASYTTPSSTSEMPASSVGVTAYYVNADNGSTSNEVSLSGSTYSTTFNGSPGGKITLSQTAKSGFTFDGYYVSSSSISSPYDPTSASAITIEARYTEVASTVSLAASPEGSGTFTIGGAAATSTKAGVATTRSVTAVDGTGYNFTSWAITGGASISSTSTNPTTVTGGGAGTAATLTATFTPKTYSITLDGNDGSDGSATATYNSSTLTSVTHCSRASYDLNGYYTATSGGTKVINANGTLVASTAYTNSSSQWTYDDDVELHAQWTYNPVTYSVTYAVGTGYTSYGSLSAKNTSTSAAISSGSSVESGTGVTFIASPNAHYKVAGWYSDASCSSAIAGAGTANTYSTTISANTTVYVKFVLIQTSITLNLHDGSGSTAVTATHGSALPSFTAATRTGYTLQGYYTAESSGTKIINADKSLVASVSGYTDGSSKWIYTGTALTLHAQWSENMTTVTVNVSPTGAGTLTVGGAAFTPGNTTTAGVATSRTVVATAANDYAFSSWSVSGNATGTSSTNTYTLKGNGSGSTGTLTANFTVIPVNLLYGNTTPLNSPTDGGAMSYDLETGAYYKDVTTNSSPYYFRFDYNSNSEQYSGNWNSYPDVVEATGDGTKVDCNQTVKGWDNKASIKYTGASGSSIRIWFDFQNKKAWITETTYSVTVAAGSGGSVSPTSVSGVGATTASGDITATPDKGYVFTGWTLPSGTSAAAGYTAASNPIHINATAASKTITANFAAATAFIEGRFHVTNAARDGSWTNTFSEGNWDENSTRIKFTWDGTNNRYELHTYAKPKELSTQISSYNPVFYVKESSSSSSLDNVTSYWSATSQTLTAAGTGNKKSLVSSGTFHNDYLRFNSTDESGYTILYFDEAGIWYELEQRLQFNGNDNTGGSAPTGTYGNNTYHAKDGSITAPANTYSKTGYHFTGWKVNNEGALISAGASVTMNADKTLYAQWEPDSYTVTLDVEEDHKGSTTGATTSHTVYYNTVTTNIPNLPTAENYYGLDGYYTDQNGAGTKLINGDGTWIASVEGYTDEDKKWISTSGVTLYAYYKASEIADLELSPASIAPNGTVTATPNISPLPQGTTCVCWKFLRNNGNPYPGVTFSSNPSSGNAAVTFTAPSVSGTYKVACILRTGSTCGSGTVLDSIVANLVVAGEHTVTIQYQDGDGRSLKDTIHTIGKPLEWSSSTISPATITGYTFARWEAGDGVFITDDGGTTTQTTTTKADIKIKANYEGTLTAVYTKKRMIYFYNTLGWGSVYVYFYKNDSYWETGGSKRGSGSKTTSTWTDTPYELGKHGQMQPVSEGSNIYYFDAEAEGVPSTYDDVVFTEHSQHNYEFFYETNAVRRGDYKTSMPMFVPLTGQTADVHNKTNYYNSGYWMNYPENTGYTLKIYNNAYATKETEAVQSIAFPYSEDKTMPLKMDVELSDGYNHEYWFMVYRNDGTYMGSEYHFKQGYQDEQTITGGNTKNKITTSAPGNYTFILTYHGNGSGTNNYYIDVDFPIATGDYRIYYSDNATWSKGAHTKDSWHHPSHSIAKATDAKNDTVSFFISKGDGITHTMKFQKASVTNDGVVSWSDVDGGSITIPSSVEESGVYNFIVSQPAGGASIALEKVEPYTGNFYIRTDCAGNTKWDSFKNADHQMTYSDYAEANSGFSHYYAHWVTSGMNVKFVIANDYSMCISDTLIEDYGTTIADISNIGVLNSGNASIRFMWNQATNKISRAYISGSSNVADRFLVLEGDAKLYDENGNHYSISGLNANEVNLIDDENFVYERTIQVNATACAKLTAKYNNNVQYFKGGSGSTASDSVQLLGGTYNVDKKYPMRIVYDFKTNRLVTAYMPEGEIDGTVAINADMMLIREHQGDATQLTFADGDAKLTEVKTVYGVMRFNRWTLNNRQHPEDMNKDHSKTNDSISTYHPYVDPGDVKSISERGLYWISFPFDVKLNDVFGLGTYGEHWIMMEYNGAARAKEGYWKDSEGFWEYIWNRNGVTLEKGKGYVLALELDLMQATNTDFWSNNIQQVELFFPSASSTTGTITQTDADVTVPSHLCTIDRRTDKSVADWNKDRRIADSHWNIIGVPSFANYNKALTDGSSTITWHANPKTQDLPFLYEWNSSDNTYTVQSGTTYPFKAMHAYYVQYAGTLHWTLASATPSSIVARRTYADKPQNVEFQLQLQQNEKMIDQTFVKLSNDETASVNFSFGEDLNKEFNSGKANIYTFIENYIPAAGNTLPLTEQTTVVPMGVKIATNGDYTFSIPSGTNGVGVTLVDNETGIRTNLALMDYTIALEAGTQDDRFYLEISPIKHVATDIENTDAGDHVSNVRKMMVDGLLYIIKDGKVFDAHGARVK